MDTVFFEWILQITYGILLSDSIAMATTAFFAVLSLVVFLITLVAIKTKIGLALRTVALVLFVLYLPISFGFLTALLGRPEPLKLSWQLYVKQKDVNIVAYDIQEGKAIYLLLKMPDRDEPFYIVMPYKREMAKQLRSAWLEVEQNGGQVRFNNPFERSFDPRDNIFYPEPPPPLPDKNY